MKKSRLFTTGVLALTLVLGLVLAGCPTDDSGGNNNSGNDTDVTLINVIANGSATQTSTQLTLTFSQAITGLSASNITLSGVSGVSKGTLSGTGPAYTLGISGFTSGGTLSVAVAKSGYNISGSPETVSIYYYNVSDIIVTLSSVTANGSATETTTQLELYFTDDIPGLSVNDITLSGVSGVTKGTLSGTGPAYTLGISGFTSGGTLNVAVAKSGYAISGSPKSAPIFYYNVGDTIVTLLNVTADGSATETTTQLELYFDDDIPGLSASDITLSGVSGVSKGTITEIEPYYHILSISGFTSGGTLSVAVAKSGYAISGSPKTVTIYYSGSSGSGDIAVTFNSVTANGSATETTTQLTLTFSQAITGLSASDITLSGVSGVTKGTLSGSGPAYTLDISGFTASGTLSVAVAKSGYAITGSPQTAPIYYSSSAPTPDGSSKENAIQLTENIWADGEFISSSTAQWFKFTATTAQQYIHVSFGTLSSNRNLLVQVYDSNGVKVKEDYVAFPLPNLYDTWDVSLGDEYYVMVWSYGTGSYQIGFTKSVLRPGTRTTLVINEWSDGNIATGSGEQWFKFTATAATHYIHFSPGTLTYAYVYLYNSDGNLVGNGEQMTPGGNTYMSRTTISGQEYHIMVRPSSGSGGTPSGGSYRIGFNTSSTAPGISWTPIDTGSFGEPYAIAFGNGRFVGVTPTGYSTNGVSWTAVSMGNISTGGYNDIAYSTGSSANNRFVAVSNSGYMAMSSDGTSWTYVTPTTFGSSSINGITFGVGTFGARFVAVGADGKMAYATNSLAFGFTAADSVPGISTLYDVAYGNEKFVAVGQGGKAVYSSDGGVTWNTVSDMKLGTSVIYGITYGNGKFVAVGQDGKAAYSSDGLTWTAVNDTTFGSSNIRDIAYGGGKFVMVGNDGKAAYSSDGITWNAVDNTTFSSGYNGTIYTIAYGGGRFVVAAEMGMAYWVTP